MVRGVNKYSGFERSSYSMPDAQMRVSDRKQRALFVVSGANTRRRKEYVAVIPGILWKWAEAFSSCVISRDPDGTPSSYV